MTEAISCIDGFEIATPRQVGARNDKGLPPDLVTHGRKICVKVSSQERGNYVQCLIARD